jgi:ParB-like chromosome segregation protein Spo0J
MAGGKTEVNITAIELDASIQCRAVIDTGTVAEYAERMEAGDAFPPVVLFGTVKRCWIGDGWHRVMAARQLGRTEIEADLREGDRRDALRYALGANAANGLRRTNDDKRRCVELALVAFGGLSSRAIAEMCGVGDQLVRAVRPEEQVRESRTSTVTGTDGKQDRKSVV